MKELIREILVGWVYSHSNRYSRKIRGLLYGTKSLIDAQVKIQNPKSFHAPKGSALYHGTHILNQHGQFILGERSHLGAFCHVNVAKGTVILGDDVSVGPGCKIIAYSNHFEPGKPNSAVRIQEDVSIGNDVFIGANCTVLPGTTIEDRVVIGANSVVKGTLAGGGIYVGCPAKWVKPLPN